MMQKVQVHINIEIKWAAQKRYQASFDYPVFNYRKICEQKC